MTDQIRHSLRLIPIKLEDKARQEGLSEITALLIRYVEAMGVAVEYQALHKQKELAVDEQEGLIQKAAKLTRKLREEVVIKIGPEHSQWGEECMEKLSKLATARGQMTEKWLASASSLAVSQSRKEFSGEEDLLEEGCLDQNQIPFLFLSRIKTDKQEEVLLELLTEAKGLLKTYRAICKKD